MTLADLVRREVPPTPWAEGDNIPWNEPAFSERMLREHLSQSHDLASRRAAIIDRHVAALDALLDGSGGTRVLDLGCGPGLYLHRLARRGHHGHGVDFSPASIAHARAVAAEEGLDCAFEQGDLREVALGPGFDLALFLYGQVNVFPREVAGEVLTRAHAALRPGASLVLEAQTAELVRGDEQHTTDWSATSEGLFSPTPHLLLHERFWDEPSRTATDRWYVVDAASGSVERYAMSTCAYTTEELTQLLGAAGFEDVRAGPWSGGDDEQGSRGLVVLSARR